jgi:competence protein ComEC
MIILLIFLRFLSTKPIYKNGDFIKITSKVYAEPIIYDNQQYIKLQNLSFYLSRFPEINYGDTVVVTGIVENNKLKSPKLLEIKENRNFLYSFREKLIYFYKSTLPEPYSSLVAGIVIGSKNMPQSFWEKLKMTGTAHVVVASGTNVTLTISFLIGVLTVFLKRRPAIWISLLGVLGYIFLSGFEAPIVRAGIMGSILLFGQERGRVVNSWRILIYSALIMLLIKPNWIVDIGFILSFVATISLMLMQKKIDLALKIIPAIFREGLSTSIAAQIGVAPIIFVTFGQFNILSPVINALILWTIPYIMIGGAVAGVVGLIVPIFGKMMLYVIFPFLIWFTKILEIFSF